jgi:chromosome segregation ATPase
MGPIPSTQQQIQNLERRQEQLEERLRRCRAAAEQSPAPNPSLGREVDDMSSVLARVRAELAQLGSG